MRHMGTRWPAVSGVQGDTEIGVQVWFVMTRMILQLRVDCEGGWFDTGASAVEGQSGNKYGGHEGDQTQVEEDGCSNNIPCMEV